MRQGMASGAGMTLLLIGPVTSYGTLLVLRKEYGAKYFVFLGVLIVTSLLLGIGFHIVAGINGGKDGKVRPAFIQLLIVAIAIYVIGTAI